MIDLAYPVSETEVIQSPAERYVAEQGGNTIPFLMLYRGKRLVGTLEGKTVSDYDEIIRKALE